jgi:aspartyl/asparaginyl-tRNA synthetase
MEKFPYPLNIIPITYSIIIEIQEMITQINNNNQNKKYTKKLEFLLNLPPEYNFININELINLINNQIINKIEKLYNNIKIDLSITKENFDNFLNITIIYNK